MSLANHCFTPKSVIPFRSFTSCCSCLSRSSSAVLSFALPLFVRANCGCEKPTIPKTSENLANRQVQCTYTNMQPMLHNNTKYNKMPVFSTLRCFILHYVLCHNSESLTSTHPYYSHTTSSRSNFSALCCPIVW